MSLLLFLGTGRDSVDSTPWFTSKQTSLIVSTSSTHILGMLTGWSVNEPPIPSVPLFCGVTKNQKITAGERKWLRLEYNENLLLWTDSERDSLILDDLDAKMTCNLSWVKVKLKQSEDSNY